MVAGYNNSFDRKRATYIVERGSITDDTVYHGKVSVVSDIQK